MGMGGRGLLCMLFLLVLVLPAPSRGETLLWGGRKLVVEDLAPSGDALFGPAGGRFLLDGVEFARRADMAPGRPRLVDLRRTGREDLLVPWMGGGTGRHLVLELYGLDGNAERPARLAVLGEEGDFIRGSFSLDEGRLGVSHELGGYLPRAGGIRCHLRFRWRRGSLTVLTKEYEAPETFVDRMNLACAFRLDGRSVEAREILVGLADDEALAPSERSDASELLSRLLRASGEIDDASRRARAAVDLSPDGAAARHAADRLLREKLSRLGLPRPEKGGER